MHAPVTSSPPLPSRPRVFTGWPWVALALAFLLLIARIYCASVYRVDSDEPQHLHVVWGVTQGMVQYRDLFDNHSPLFALLNAPLFHALGERADIVTLMRMAMIPFYFGCVAWVYWIGARVFSRRCGAWAALITAFHPRFFCTSLEFRPDDLWAFCWLSILGVLVCVRRPGWRAWLAGLLVGTAFSVSMKTTVMVLDLALAGSLAWFVSGRPRLDAPLKSAALFVVGLALVPGALLAWFTSQGALDHLFYCLIRHNLIAASERHHWLDLRGLTVLAALGAVVWWSRRLVAERDGFRRGFLMLAGGIYPVLLFVVWPLVTREDFLALIPVASLVVVAAVGALGVGRTALANTALGAALAVLVALDFQTVTPWEDRSRFHEEFVASALKLTDPGEEVMDTKGEMIFRPRPIYFALEEMTRWRFKRKQIDDNLPEQMIARGVCVASDNFGRYPTRTKRFIKKNFIPVSFRTLVAGKIVNPLEAVTYFDIAIPARYAVIPKMGGAIEIDGKPCSEFVALAPGRHSLTTSGDAGPVAVVWAQAVERGFNPFYKLSPDEKAEVRRSNVGNIL